MEEDKGSPPGHLPVASQTEEKIVFKEEKNVDNGKNEDVEGVPPTWPSIPPILQPVRTSGDVGMLDNQADDEDRPPLGCQFRQPHDLQKLLLLFSDVEMCQTRQIKISARIHLYVGHSVVGDNQCPTFTRFDSLIALAFSKIETV